MDKLEGIILSHEQNKLSNTDFIQDAKRILHNIKGESGMMGFSEISDICHIGESLLVINIKNISTDKILSIKDWINKSIEFFGKIKHRLKEYIFLKRSTEITQSAQIDLFDLGYGTSDIVVVKNLVLKISKIQDLAMNSGCKDVFLILEKISNFLKYIMDVELCLISGKNYPILLEFIENLRNIVRMQINKIIGDFENPKK